MTRVRLEAPFSQPIPQDEPRWTAREAVRKFAELQGQRANLIPVLQSGAMPDHAHYGEGLYKSQQEFLSPRSQVLSIVNQPRIVGNYAKVNRVSDSYQNFFRQNGIRGSVKADFDMRDPVSTMKVTIWRGDFFWPPEKVVQLFPMIDFKLGIEMSDDILLEERGTKTDLEFVISDVVFANATKIEGPLYKVDFATGDSLSRSTRTWLESIERRIQYHGMIDCRPDRERKIDAFVVSERSQDLLNTLLATRV